jgi:signal transduction histidine kinase
MPLSKPLYSVILLMFIQVSKPLYGQLNGEQQVYLYEDSAKQLTAASALELFRQQKFMKPASSEINIGFTRSVFWLLYQNDMDFPADSLLLYIGHHHINRIHFFFEDSSGLKQQWVTGDYFPFLQRPVKATGFYFPVNKKGLYLARIDKSNESLQLSFKLIPRLQALVVESNNKAIMALFTGMILLLIIFGIYLFVISKDRVYVFYILYIATGWLWVLSNAGYGFQYLWPGLPWFASKARPVFALAPMIFSLLFLPRYIGGIQMKKVLVAVKIMNWLLLGCIISILTFDEEGYQNKWWFYIQYLIPIISLAYVLITFGILIRAALKQNKLAMFYLAAVLCLLIFAILQVSFSLGSLNRFGSFFNNFGLSVGYITEAIILTAGLVYRFNQYRLEKENLLIKMNASQIQNTRILMEVQQAERGYVANQLHDVAGSLLSAARLNLSGLREKARMQHAQTEAVLLKTEEAVSMVSDMVRNLSHALSPVMLEKVGFKTALEKILAIVNASGKIKVELLIIGFEKYNPALNAYYNTLYGIIYELLNNIIKHAGACNVLLQVTEHLDCFTLIAEDDGLGMKIPEEVAGQNMGLAGIQSKINFFKGSVAFDKNTPRGLITTIELPIKAYEL